MVTLPWDQIELEATRVLSQHLPRPPPPPCCPPRTQQRTPPGQHQRLLPGGGLLARPPQPAPAPAPATLQDLAAADEGQARQRQQQEANKALALAESAYTAAQDGTRALRLAHRHILVSRAARAGGKRLTLDQLRVLIDTGLLFVGQEWEMPKPRGGGAEEEGDAEVQGSGWAALSELVAREAVTHRRVERLERENRQLVAQQQQVARLLARTVTALEALTLEREA